MNFTTTHISDRINEIEQTIHAAHWAEDTVVRLRYYKGAVAMMTEVHSLYITGHYWFSEEEITEMMRMNEEILDGMVEVSEDIPE